MFLIEWMLNLHSWNLQVQNDKEVRYESKREWWNDVARKSENKISEKNEFIKFKYVKKNCRYIRLMLLVGELYQRYWNWSNVKEA